MTRGGFSREVREQIVGRDGGRCVRCGMPVPAGEGSIHHRRPRGMGGTRRRGAGLASNGLLLCGSGTTGCHGWVESHREEARRLGMLVPLSGDPVMSPVRYWDGEWYMLGDRGLRLRARGDAR